MAKNIQDNGKLIKCKEKEFSLGLIKNVIKEILKKINLMDKGNLIGLMESLIMENGKVVK